MLLGAYVHPCVPASISAPRKPLEFPSENSIFQIQLVNHFLWFIFPLVPNSLTLCHGVLNFSPSTSSIITKQSGVNFASYFSFLLSILLNCLFFIFEISTKLHCEAFYPDAGIYWSLFPLCHHSSCVLWFTVLFFFSPILRLDAFCNPVKNILLAVPFWSSGLLLTDLFS